MKKTLGVLSFMLCATPMIYAQADGIATHESSDVAMALNGSAMGKVISSGSCGKNVNYELYDDYTLRIFGSGPMNNFNYDAPWWGYQENIKTVIIEDGVTRIGAIAFARCSSLTEVIISNSVTSIGSEAFSGCEALTKIDIPNSVTSIGSAAFQDCISLAEVNLPNGIESIERNVFLCCSSLTHITIPNSVTSIEPGAFFCTSLEEIIIPDNVTSIGDIAFMGCDNLKYVKIGKSVTSLGEISFFHNPNDMKMVVEITAETLIIQSETTPFGNPEDVTIYVPKTTLDGYRNSADWSYYKNSFVGYDSTTGISHVGYVQSAIKVDAIYDLQGRKVPEMRPNGIYIVNGKKVNSRK